MKNEDALTVDQILNTIELNLQSDSQSLSLEEISGIICAVWWSAFNLKVGRNSHVFYDCILWASRMHANYCNAIIDRFIHKAPKIICKTKDSENYKNLLSIIIHHPTKQMKNLNRYSLLKIKGECRTLFKRLLIMESEYLINQNIEMAFCVLQIITCMERESLVKFFTQPADNTFAKLLKDRNEIAFKIFGEWTMDDLTAGVQSCECQERKST
jgi:hypothetical protein